MNCIIEGGLPVKVKRNAIPELDYLTQISFELYESEYKSEPGDSEGAPNKSAYSIRVAISPGCHSSDPLDMHLDSKHCIGVNARRSLTSHLDWKYVINTLREKFHRVKLPKRFIPINLGETHKPPFLTESVVDGGENCLCQEGWAEKESSEAAEVDAQIVKEAAEASSSSSMMEDTLMEDPPVLEEKEKEEEKEKKST